ncbi:MAG: DNA sulfur modification protein DndB [Acidimicrobiales bacterium]
MSDTVIPGAIQEEVNESPTPLLPFLHGFFNKPNHKVPYFSFSLNPETAADIFVLASEIPKSDGVGWALEELFQRDIDWKRVDNQLVPYLRDEVSATFFGSLTIALIPFNPLTRETLDSFDEWDGWTPPQPHPQAAKTVEVGPVSISWWQDWDDITSNGAIQGSMAWDKKQVMAVAIDGQHRLAAYKQLAEKDRAVLKNYRIPVSLLIFDESVGYQAPDGEEDGISVLRELFIDLNKHAKQVSRTRQILLDDSEPHAICVRRILSRRLENDTASLTSGAPTLPVSLVDWHSDSAKFDSGPYITTVITLDWAVKTMLGRPVQDYMRHKSVRTELKNLQVHLDIDLSAAISRLGQNEENERIFTYDDESLHTIQDAFGRNLMPSLIKIFRDFSPYSDVISIRENNGSTKMNFSEWDFLRNRDGDKASLELSEFEEKELIRGTSKDDFEQKLQDVQDYKSQEDRKLAFAAVFQKAVILAWWDWIKFTIADLAEIEPLAEDILDLDAEVEENITLTEDPLTELDPFERYSVRTSEFIEVLNRIVLDCPKFLDIHMAITSDDCIDPRFWSGALLKPDDGTIDFAEAAAVRASKLIFLLVGMVIFDEKYDPEPNTPFDDFWDKVQHHENPGNFIKQLRVRSKQLISTTGAGGQATRIMNAMQVTWDEEKANKEVEERLKFVWSKLGL